MKKKTNKILWITLFVVVFFMVVPCTITFQIFCRKHPEIYQPHTPQSIEEMITDMDSIFQMDVPVEDEALPTVEVIEDSSFVK